MTDEQGKDNYIKCSMCKCKYINDEEHIQVDFGYNRLNVRYKCCVKCKNKWRENASELSDKQRKYYIPCEICNIKYSKYTMKRHVEVCMKIQSLREEMNKE